MITVKALTAVPLTALAAALLACLAVPARAVPAHPRAAAVAQADGSTVTVRLRGDEYHHWHEDRDGYTVLKDPAARNWFYAEQAADGTLRPGAHRLGAAEPAKLGLKRGLKDARRIKAGAARRQRDEAARRARLRLSFQGFGVLGRDSLSRFSRRRRAIPGPHTDRDDEEPGDTGQVLRPRRHAQPDFF